QSGSGMKTKRVGRLVAARGGLRHLAGEKIQPYPLPDGRELNPTRLFRDRDGSMWIGTSDRGILHLHAGRADAFAQADGLSSESVSSIFEDREGNVWVGTGTGLDRFRNFAVSTLTAAQGLTNTRVASILTGRDGSVWLGSDRLNKWSNGQITAYGHLAQRKNGVGSGREILGSGLPE